MPQAKYRVIGKHIFRTHTTDFVQGTRADGSPNIVRQFGGNTRLEVGTILDDVTFDELAAFGTNRLELVSEEDEQAQRKAEEEVGGLPSLLAPQRGVHEPVNAIGEPIQVPMPSGEEVAAVKAGMVEVRKLEKEQAEQRDKQEKEMEEARAKAMTETATRTMEQQRQESEQAQTQARQASRPARPASGASSTPASETPATPPASESRRQPH